MPEYSLPACDVALACGYALQFKLIDHLAVRKWGDAVIAQVEIAPLWAIDLADCHVMDVDERLRQVPGQTSLEIWPRIIAGLIFVRWHQDRLTVGALRGIGWTLYTRFDESEPFRWGVELEHFGDEFDAEFITANQLHFKADAIVRSLSSCEAYVPTWMR